jgi:hypothetical protein
MNFQTPMVEHWVAHQLRFIGSRSQHTPNAKL